jgi:Protein of unknown function (DUF3467)
LRAPRLHSETLLIQELYSLSMTESTGPKAVKADIKWPSDTVAHDYANAVAATQSPWDISLFFGPIDIPLSAPGAKTPTSVNLKPRLVSAIRLPPAVAKQLLEFLGTQVAFYENAHGPISDVTGKPEGADDETNV